MGLQPIFYFVNPDHYASVAYSDQSTKILSTKVKALQIAVGTDGIPWIMTTTTSTDGNYPGNQVMYWDDSKNEFVYPVAQKHYGVKAICRLPEKGSVLGVTNNKTLVNFNINPDYSGIFIDDFDPYMVAVGNVPNANGIYEMWFVLPILDKHSDGYTAFLSPFGNNPLKNAREMVHQLDPVMLSANNGNCYFVNRHGAVLAYNTEGEFGTWSEEHLAIAVSASQSGLYMLSKDADPVNGGAVVKKYDHDGDHWDAMSIGAIDICAV